MTYKDFIDKYFKTQDFLTKEEINKFLKVLDYFYCAENESYIHQMITDFYLNADNIYNSSL